MYDFSLLSDPYRMKAGTKIPLVLNESVSPNEGDENCGAGFDNANATPFVDVSCSSAPSPIENEIVPDDIPMSDRVLTRKLVAQLRAAHAKCMSNGGVGPSHEFERVDSDPLSVISDNNLN